MLILSAIKSIFSSGNVVKSTLDGISGFTKDIKTLITGKVDQETLLKLEEKFAQLDNAIAEHQASVISAEAQGSWLQRNWRPITMLTFLLLTILNQFGLLTIKLSDEIWGLFKIGLGGYVGGRSLEKIASTLKR